MSKSLRDRTIQEFLNVSPLTASFGPGDRVQLNPEYSSRFNFPMRKPSCGTVTKVDPVTATAFVDWHRKMDLPQSIPLKYLQPLDVDAWDDYDSTEDEDEV